MIKMGDDLKDEGEYEIGLCIRLCIPLQGAVWYEGLCSTVGLDGLNE